MNLPDCHFWLSFANTAKCPQVLDVKIVPCRHTYLPLEYMPNTVPTVYSMELVAIHQKEVKSVQETDKDEVSFPNAIK